MSVSYCIASLWQFAAFPVSQAKSDRWAGMWVRHTPENHPYRIFLPANPIRPTYITHKTIISVKDRTPLSFVLSPIWEKFYSLRFPHEIFPCFPLLSINPVKMSHWHLHAAFARNIHRQHIWSRNRCADLQLFDKIEICPESVKALRPFWPSSKSCDKNRLARIISGRKTRRTNENGKYLRPCHFSSA